MRLINTKTMELEDHDPRKTKYAILSHTWGTEELLFADITGQKWFKSPRSRKALGYKKVAGACKLAQERGFRYIWIDTCCIDKTSSAELSEAINSMWAWYQQAKTCFAYLSDVDNLNRAPGGLENSRWFKRGWTLQELLAPRRVEFLNQQWQPIGHRGGLALTISEITGIDVDYLTGYILDWTPLNIPVATRMSWMANRETTRGEDMAYCLMGLFGVNMPLLYGEGEYKAFLRLQQEILRNASDQSILLWARARGHTYRNLGQIACGVLAVSPKDFSRNWLCGGKVIGCQRDSTRFGMELYPHGLQIRVWLCPCKVGVSIGWEKDSSERWLAVLDCNLTSALLARPAILLKKVHNSEAFERVYPGVVAIVQPGAVELRTNRSGRLFGGDPWVALPGYVWFDEAKLSMETILLHRNNVQTIHENDVPFEVLVHSKTGRLGYMWTLSPQLKHDYMPREYGSTFLICERCTDYGEEFVREFQGVLFLKAEAKETNLFLLWWGFFFNDSPVVSALRNGEHVRDQWVVKCGICPWLESSGSGTRENVEDYVDDYFRIGRPPSSILRPDEMDRLVQVCSKILPQKSNSSAEYHSKNLHFKFTAKKITFLEQQAVQLIVEEIV